MASVRAFVVTTVCKDVDEFVERYHARVEGRSVFVSAIEERALEGECAFAILLANRRPVLAGVCEVIEVFRDNHNEFFRRGMRLGIARLGVESEAVWAQLVARRDRRSARGTPSPVDYDELVDLTCDAIPLEVEDDDPSVIASIEHIGASIVRSATET
jgi:hypothetical protein